MPEKKSISLNRGREESLGNDDVLASKQCRTPAFQFPIFFPEFSWIEKYDTRYHEPITRSLQLH